MRSGGGSLAHLGLHVGQDWSTWLSTYPDHAPILDITAGSTTVAFCITGNKADRAAVEFARELARGAAAFAAEVERLHAQHSQDSGTGETRAGSGEAA